MIYIFTLIIVGITSLIFSTIRYEITKMEYHIGKTNKELKNDYEIIMKILIFNKVPIIKIKITLERLLKLLRSSRARKIEKKEERKIVEDKNKIDIKILRNIKCLKQAKIEIKKFNLNMEIGVEDVVVRSMLVTVASAVLANILAKKAKDLNQIYFKIVPTNVDINKLDISLYAVFDMKIRNIFKVYKLMTKEDKKINNKRLKNNKSFSKV